MKRKRVRRALWVGDAPGGNYTEAISKLMATTEVPPGTVLDVNIEHDDQCAMIKNGALCNCNPTLTVSAR